LLYLSIFTSRKSNFARNGVLKELSNGKEAIEEFGKWMSTFWMSVGAPAMKSI